MRVTYSPELTLGHALVIVSLLLNAGVMALPRDSDVKILQRDVARHERLLEQLTTGQNLLSANLQTLTAIVDSHTKTHNHESK